MLIKLGRFDFTECWDGVLYKNLSQYPDVTEWEMQNVLDFISYEKTWGRSCRIEASEEQLEKLAKYKNTYSKTRVPVPSKLTECTACPRYRGCMTEFVCHTSPIENALKILDSGSLLSAVRARGMSGEELKRESRNAANDPADYFEYVMFSWGNCQAGDRLVNERRLGRSPTNEELGAGFTPGVRFYFRYGDIVKHPGVVFDGVLPLKIRDEVKLCDRVYAVVVPEMYRDTVRSRIPGSLLGKVHYLDSSGTDIWEWSEKVYEYIKSCEGVEKQ